MPMNCNKKVCNSHLLSHVPLLICHVYWIAHCFLLNQLVRVQVHSSSGQVQFCTDALCDEWLNSKKPKSSGQNSAQGNERKTKKPDNQQHSLICEIQLHLLVCFICCLLSIVLSISALFLDADQSSRLFTKWWARGNTKNIKCGVTRCRREFLSQVFSLISKVCPKVAALWSADQVPEHRTW